MKKFSCLLTISFLLITYLQINANPMKYRVTANSLIIRSAPSTQSNIISMLPKNSIVELIEITDKNNVINSISAEWYKIKSEKNFIGYVFSGYLELIPIKKLETVKVDIPFNSTYILLFDTNYISKDELTNCLKLHPSAIKSYNNVPDFLELCSESKEYVKCGSRDINDPNFFKNAEVNLKSIMNIIDELNKITYCNELEPLVDYYKELKQYEYWMQKTRFDFYQKWDINILKQKYKKIDPTSCAINSIRKIYNAPNTTEKYKLAWYEWHNEINHYFRDFIIDDKKPISIWNKFIKDKHIQEKKEIKIMGL